MEYYTVTYACDRCEKDIGYAHMKSVHPPVPLVKHSLAPASSVADVMTKKYADQKAKYRKRKPPEHHFARFGGVFLLA